MRDEHDPYAQYNYGDSTVVKWVLSFFAVVLTAQALWLGSSVIEVKTEVAALNAKVDFLIRERPHERP